MLVPICTLLFDVVEIGADDFRVSPVSCPVSHGTSRNIDDYSGVTERSRPLVISLTFVNVLKLAVNFHDGGASKENSFFFFLVSLRVFKESYRINSLSDTKPAL